MRSLLVLLASVTLFTSCLTDSKIRKEAYARGICRTVKDSTRIKDSLVIRYRDSIIFHAAKEGPKTDLAVEPSEDTAHQCRYREFFEKIKKNPVKKTENGLTSTVSSKDGKSLQFECNAEAYADTLKNVRIERDFWHFEYNQKVEEVQKPCPDEHRTWVDHACRWFTAIVLLIIGLFVLYVYLKRKLRGRSG